MAPGDATFLPQPRVQLDGERARGFLRPARRGAFSGGEQRKSTKMSHGDQHTASLQTTGLIASNDVGGMDEISAGQPPIFRLQTLQCGLE